MRLDSRPRLARVHGRLDGGPRSRVVDEQVRRGAWRVTRYAGGTSRARPRTSATRTDFLGLEPLEERWLLAVFQSGDIFLARSDGEIEHLNGNGSFIEQFDSHSSLGADEQPRGMALDDGHNLFVTNPFAASVSRFDSGGSFVASFGDGYSGEPQSIVFDQDGNAFIGAITAAPGDPAVNAGKPFDNRIREFNPAGGLIGQFQVIVEAGGVGWIDLAADQHTLYYTSGGDRILRYDTRTETQLSDFNTEALAGSQAQGFKILPSGGVLVADTQTIERLDANGAVMQSYDADEVDSWFDVHLDPDGTSFWAADKNSGDLSKFDLASGDELLHLETGESDDLFGLAIVDEPMAARNRVSVSNVERLEGNSGTTEFVFAISLEHATEAPLTLRYATVDRTAQLLDNDYQQLSGEVTFLPGDLTKQVTVGVVGDLKSENDEQFQLLVEDPFGSAADPTIAATANLYQAGSAGGQGGTAPISIPIDPSGSGTLSFPSLRVETPLKAGDAWPEINTADGATQQFENPRGTNISSFGGLSGIRADRFMFLAGMFVSETTPSENNMPDSLDFRPVGTTSTSLGTQFEQLAPELNQVFYIGDGWTDAGALQRFVAPQGATRLLLGFVDGEFFGSEAASPPGFYDDNTGAIRATLEQNGGLGTILDDPDPLPNASIDSVSHREPASNVMPFVFHVTLDAPSGRVITVPYHTEDGTASSASGDYVATTGTLTFLPGAPLSQPVTVLVNADNELELDESFKVVLGPATNATADESPGFGTIEENGLLSLDLADEDDSGVSNTDNLTNVAAPHFLVGVARAGLLSIDVEGSDSVQPQPVEVLAGSLTAFQPPVPLRDGVYTIRAVLDSEEFDPIVQTLTFTIDTRGPKLLGVDGAGTALQFDGVDDLVAIPDSPAFDVIELKDSFTIEAWIRIDGWDDGWYSVINKYEADSDFGWTVQINDESGIEFNTGDAAQTGIVPPLHEWTHLAVSYARSEGIIRFYLNGQQVYSQPYTADIPDTSGEPLYLGFNPFGGEETSDGAIDDLILWDHVRTAAEIATDMQGQLNGAAAGLVGLWRFNEAAGSTAHDEGPNHLDGILGNGEPNTNPAWVISGAQIPIDRELVAPISSREWIFSEPIDFAIADLAEQFSLTGPRSRVIRSISGSGATYTLKFDRTFTPGDYTIAGPLAIADLAGNLIDQDQDGIGGEPGQDEPVDKFKLLPAIPHSVAISNVSQNEGDSGLTSFVFTFTLDAASDRPIDVAYETHDGTATVADQDYVAQQGTVTFAPGTTVQKVTVLVRADTGIEPNETFSLVMTDDQEGTLTQEPGGGTGTIINDDGFFPAPIPPLFPGQPPLTSQHQPPPPQEPEVPLGTGIATPLVIPIQPGLILNFSPPLAPRSEQQVDDITSPLDLRGTRQATNMLEKEFALLSFLADDDHARLLGVEPGDETPEAPPQVARPTLARTEVETKKPIEEAALEEASSFQLWWLAMAPFVLGGGKLAWDRWQRSQPRALTRASGGASDARS